MNRKRIRNRERVRMWWGKLVGTYCPECGGKAAFRHYKGCTRANHKPPKSVLRPDVKQTAQQFNADED